MKRWLIILLAAGFCIAAMLRWRELKDFGSQIFYEYGEADAPDGELFDRMAEAERSEGKTLPDMAAWTVEENVEVENRSLGRVQKADRMLVWGDRELAVKRGLEAGNYGYPSDPRACVISRGLAMELFGSYAVVGMEVRCQGTDYLVRGVTQDDRRMVIVPASGSSDRFPYVLLDYGADRGDKSGADQLLYRYDAGSGALPGGRGDLPGCCGLFCISAGVGGPGTVPVCVFCPGETPPAPAGRSVGGSDGSGGLYPDSGSGGNPFSTGPHPLQMVGFQLLGPAVEGDCSGAALCGGERPRLVDDAAAGADDCGDSVRNRRGPYGYLQPFRRRDCKENVIDTQGQNE